MPKSVVNVNEQVQVPAQKKQASITMKDWIKKYEGQIAKALPSVITPERFTRIATTAVAMNPELGKCTPASFIGALMTAAQLGLEVNTPLGQAYLIPYNNYKTGQKEAQFQIGYKGLIELAYRSGDIEQISAEEVYENDEFEFELGFDTSIKHKPALKGRGELIGVYALYKLKSGGKGVCYMSVEDINNFRKKYSKAKSSPWDTSFEAMAKKTCLKQVLKYAPLKSDFARAMTNEDVTMNFRSEYRDKEDAVVADETTRYDDAVDVEYKDVPEGDKNE